MHDIQYYHPYARCLNYYKHFTLGFLHVHLMLLKSVLATTISVAVTPNHLKANQLVLAPAILHYFSIPILLVAFQHCNLSFPVFLNICTEAIVF